MIPLSHSKAYALSKMPNRLSQRRSSLLSKLTLLLFALALCTPLLGLPTFRYGWYLQIETLTSGLWFVGGLAALWNIALLKKNKKLAHYLWSMPVVWSWIPLIAFSVLVSFFQKAPLQSWPGSPQLADGLATYLSLLFLSPLFVLVGRQYNLRQALLWIPTLVALTLSLLTVLGAIGTPTPSLKFWKWAPMFFPDYITYFALSLGVIYGYVRPTFSKRYILDVFFSLSLGLIIFYAKNATIYVGLALSVFTYAVLRLPLFQQIPPPKKLAYYAGSGLLTLTFLICLTNFARDSLPENMSSIISRAHIGQFTFIHFFYGDLSLSKLFSFLFGQGWGDYNNAAVANLTLTQDFRLFVGDTHDSSIEFVHRDQVNSHNVFLEYFLALGSLGVVLFCYLQYKIISNLRKSHLFLGTVFMVTLGALLVFWFQLPHTLMAVTLAYCLLFSKTPSTKMSAKWVAKLPLACFSSASILFAISLTQGFSAYHYTTQIASTPKTDLFQKINQVTSTKWLLYDHLTGAPRTRQIIQGLSADLFVYLEKSPKPKLQEAGENFLKLTEHLQKDIIEGSSLTSLILSFNILSKFANHSSTKVLFDMDPRYEKAWRETAQIVAHYLPYRSDLFTPYFSYLLIAKQGEEIQKLTTYFISKRHKDPISHWFLGAHYLQTSSGFEKGICLMKQAIDYGVTNYIPLPPQQVAQLQQASGSVQCDKAL